MAMLKQAGGSTTMKCGVTLTICMKVGIIGKLEIRLQVSKKVYTAINSDCFAVILLGTLQ